MKIEIEGGKYTIMFDEATKLSSALRHGKPWRELTGDNLVLSMAQEIERLRALLDAYTKTVKPAEEHLQELKVLIETYGLKTRWRETLVAIEKLKDSYNHLKACGTVSPLNESVQEITNKLFKAIEDVLEVSYGKDPKG